MVPTDTLYSSPPSWARKVNCVRRALVLAAIGLCATAHAKPSCDERMGNLGERMKKLAADAHDFGVAVTLPRAGKGTQGAPLDRMGWIINVDATGKARLPFRDERSLAEQLDSMLAEMVDAEKSRGRAAPVYFAVEDRTPAAAVANALATARKAGLRGDALLLVAVPPPPAEPTDAALLAVPSVAAARRELEAAGRDASKKAVLVANALQKAIPPCAPVVKLFGQMATFSAQKKAELLLKVPGAMQECKCAVVDIDLFEWALLVVLDAFEDGQRWLPLPALGPRDTRTMREVIPN